MVSKIHGLGPCGTHCPLEEKDIKLTNEFIVTLCYLQRKTNKTKKKKSNGSLFSIVKATQNSQVEGKRTRKKGKA